MTRVPDPDRPPRASVIIPNWNGLALLRPCLASLAQQTFADMEVIVVDNGSSDDSVAALGTEFPWVRTLALVTNGGYTGGCNAGIAAAHGAILIMLNNDTVCAADWVEQLVAGLDAHPEAGSAASRIMLYDQRDTLNSAGDLYNENGLPNSRGVWQPYGPPYDHSAFVFSGCGGALALRREMLDEIGTFEEDFFMYCEDIDLGWRAQLAGWKCIYCPDAVIYHHLSATGGGALASFYVGRNTLWVIARNYPGPLLRRNALAITKAQWGIAREAARAWRGKAARARLRGLVHGVLGAIKWLPTRRRIQKTRRVSIDTIAALLEKPE